MYLLCAISGIITSFCNVVNKRFLETVCRLSNSTRDHTGSFIGKEGSGQVTDVSVEEYFGTSDNNCIRFKIVMKKVGSEPWRKLLNWGKAALLGRS